jgi:hypothetical protein
VGGTLHAPARFTQSNEPVTIAQEAALSSGTVWMKAENFRTPGFDLLTVQFVASHYTDYAIPNHNAV